MFPIISLSLGISLSISSMSIEISEMIDVGIQTDESLYKGKHVSAVMINKS